MSRQDNNTQRPKTIKDMYNLKGQESQIQYLATGGKNWWSEKGDKDLAHNTKKSQ